MFIQFRRMSIMVLITVLLGLMRDIVCRKVAQHEFPDFWKRPF
jgi:hypothetical protein